ncbi:helix-turn-helix domain-containing protein [Klebsiella pneumoniae]|uniref:helix-turn-helix domain-containing protein n=1 Tax=Klebsiella pneumoniae TaxID=573 RepID=UPI003A85A33F
MGAVLGIRQTAISEMERGQKTTTAEKIAKICRHYNVSADYLLGLSDDPAGGRERWEEEP